MAGSITTLGVGSGLQLQDILDQLREIDSQNITRKKTEIEKVEAQKEEFTVVKNKLLDMKGLALNLSLESTFIGRDVSSSKEEVMTASVLEGATVQSISVEVDKLAEKSSWLSEGFEDRDEDPVTLADSVFSYSMNGETVSVTVPGGTTLDGLVELINSDSDNLGLTASVIDTGDAGNPFKLLVQADETGEDGKINLLAVPDLMVMDRQQSNDETLNARVKIDGVTYLRPENSIDDILPGVTLNLVSEGTSTVAVSSRIDDVKTQIIDFVKAYNELVQEIGAKSGYDAETEDFGLLAMTTLKDVPNSLQGLMTRSVTVSALSQVTSMFNLGMEYNRDGTISIDEEVLSQRLSEDFDDVRSFFIGDAENDIDGFGDLLNDQLRLMTRSGGVVEAEKSAADVRISDIELQIEAESARLEKKYEILTKQFIELDRFMKEMTSMGNFLTSQFDSLGNQWGGGNSSK